MFISVFREAGLDDDQGLMFSPPRRFAVPHHIVCNYARCLAATRAANQRPKKMGHAAGAAAHQRGTNRDCRVIDSLL